MKGLRGLRGGNRTLGTRGPAVGTTGTQQGRPLKPGKSFPPKGPKVTKAPKLASPRRTVPAQPYKGRA